VNNLPVRADTNFHIIDFTTLGLSDPKSRLIQGDILKFVAGVYSTKNGISYSHGTKLLAVFTAHAVQHFEFDGPVMGDTVASITSQSLPDIKALNAAVPQEQWPDDLNGHPQPPWRRQYVSYFEDPQNAAILTYINNTKGAEIAVLELEGRLSRMSALCNKRLGAVIELHECIVNRKYNTKGPLFEITGWFELVNVPVWLTSATPLNQREPLQQIEHKPTEQKPAVTRADPTPTKHTGSAPWEENVDDDEPDVRANPCRDDE
jgi:hypothetical protein